MLKSPGKPVLIFGPTGNVGTHAVKHALKLHDNVHVFVRNPDKLPVAVKESVRVIVGDVADPTAVATAVTTVSPEAIIMCSAHRPKDPVAPLNAVALATIVKVLSETRRLNDCFVIYLSGMFSDLAEDPLPWYAKMLRAVMVPLSGHRASLSDNLEVTEYLTVGVGLKSGLQFTIVRMGYPIEAASKGTIVPVDYNPPGTVTFDDIGAFLVKLAHGEHRRVVLGKAIKPYYAKT